MGLIFIGVCSEAGHEHRIETVTKVRKKFPFSHSHLATCQLRLNQSIAAVTLIPLFTVNLEPKVIGSVNLKLQTSKLQT
jgi:hypothetical protein